jgi:hypothetical protein
VTLPPPPEHLQAGTYTAKLDRLYLHTVETFPDLSATLSARQGFYSGRVPSYANAGGMNVNVGVCAGIVKNTFAAASGDYKFANDATIGFTSAASSPTLNRYDIYGFQVKDNFYDSSGLNTIVPVVLQGANSAGTPSDPASPNSFIPVARGVINATATSPTLQSMIGTTVSDGGVLTIASVTVRDAISTPWTGLNIARTDRGWSEWYTGAGWHVDGIAVCSSVADRDGATGITNPFNGQFAYTTDTNTCWQRQSGAWVPWFPNGIRCELRQTAAQSIPNATFTPLTFTTEDVDTRNGHSTSVNTSRYTAQVAGRYLIAGGFSVDVNGTGSRGVVFAKNGGFIDGTQVMLASSGGLVSTIVPARSKTINLAIGDDVEIYGYQNAGGALNTLVSGSDQSSFLIEYVGA